MKNKGFTLIELLAVIIVLGLIAIITVPKINDQIEQSKKNLSKTSAASYQNAVEQYILHEKMNKNNIDLNGTYNIDENGYLYDSETEFKIEFKGEKPKNGYLIYNNNDLTSGCITINKYAITFENGEESTIEKGSCQYEKITTYSKNGLITHLDAKKNTTNGHSNNTSTWVDLSGNGYDAILYNNPTWTNNSIIFDGETNFGRIEKTANLSYESGITIEARLKLLSAEIFNDENEIPFLGNWNQAGLGLLYIEDGTFASNFYTTNGLKALNNTETNNLNEYITIAMTHNGTKATLYINGVQKAVLNNTNAITTSEAPIGIGGNPQVTSQIMDIYAHTEFQNVLIYNRALTSEEIENNYKTDLSRY